MQHLCQGRPVSRADLHDWLSYLEQAAVALTDLSSVTRTAGNPSVHRDLKPGNCIVHPQRGLVLIDISTLRLIGDGFDPVGLHTPQHTAAEALAAVHQPRTPASDAFSLGALAVYCLTGRDPRGGDADRSAVEQASRAAGVADPVALTDHVLQMIEPDPARRPDDVMQ